MSGLRYTEEFRRDAVAQVTERGYSVLEVSRRLWVSGRQWTRFNRMPGVERLEMSISARYEHYSDFGSSTDPKVWTGPRSMNLICGGLMFVIFK